MRVSGPAVVGGTHGAHESSKESRRPAGEESEIEDNPASGALLRLLIRAILASLLSAAWRSVRFNFIESQKRENRNGQPGRADFETRRPRASCLPICAEPAKLAPWYGRPRIKHGPSFMFQQWMSCTHTRGRISSVVHLFAILALAVSSGCGARDGLNRKPISGMVTCDGKPVPAGAILFEPDTYQSGTAVGATIRDGSFTIAGARWSRARVIQGANLHELWNPVRPLPRARPTKRRGRWWNSYPKNLTRKPGCVPT